MSTALRAGSTNYYQKKHNDRKHTGQYMRLQDYQLRCQMKCQIRQAEKRIPVIGAYARRMYKR